MAAVQSVENIIECCVRRDRQGCQCHHSAARHGRVGIPAIPAQEVGHQQSKVVCVGSVKTPKENGND